MSDTMTGFAALYEKARTDTPRRVAVACAEDEEVLRAVSRAEELGIAEGVLVGDADEIRRIADSLEYEAPQERIVHAPDPADAAERAVRIVSGNDADGLQADALMKGLVDTSVIMKAVLNAAWGLRGIRVLSHVALFEIPNYPRPLFLSDAAMNIAPDLDHKRQILLNAVEVAHGVGVSNPNVAILAAKEKADEKMPATLHARQLAEMSASGEITGCTVGGPFALDNAVSPEAARHKGVTHPGAGRADILIAPDIEAANILYKALVFLAGARNAGIIVGARKPIVLTSRADSDETKLNSIALAVMAGNVSRSLLDE